MVKDDSFYLMKTSSSGYIIHEEDGYKSQLHVYMDVKSTHIPSDTTERTATATSSSGRTTRTRTVTPVRRSSTTSSSSGGSSGGGY